MPRGMIRALAVEMHENWLKAHRYPNMEDLREHKKEALRTAALSATHLAPVDNAARCPQGPTTATITHVAEDSGHNSWMSRRGAGRVPSDWDRWRDLGFHGSSGSHQMRIVTLRCLRRLDHIPMIG